MAENIVSLGIDNDSEIAFDEEILQLLREEWSDLPIEAFDTYIEAILNEDNELFKDPNLVNEDQFYSSDIEKLLDAEDDEWLLAGSRQSDQQGANPLFSVERQRLGESTRWQNGTVIQDRVHLQLRQNRAPQEDLMGEQIAEAFYQNLHDYIQQEQINPAQYRLQMKIHNNTRENVWTSSPLLPVVDWMENRERTQQWL